MRSIGLAGVVVAAVAVSLQLSENAAQAPAAAAVTFNKDAMRQAGVPSVGKITKDHVLDRFARG